jgi:hypothetical protein
MVIGLAQLRYESPTEISLDPHALDRILVRLIDRFK